MPRNLIHIVIAVLFVSSVTTVSLAQQNDKNDLNAQVLEFPPENSIGIVRYRVAPSKEEAVHKAHQFRPNIPWKIAGPAKGTVRLPKNAVVMLTITSSSPEAFAALTNLPPNSVHAIGCAGSKFDGDFLTPFSHFTKLRSLDLTGTAITDEQLVALEKLSNLELLFLSRTKITGASFKHIAKLKKLRKLYLYKLQFDEESFADLARTKNLVELHLGNNAYGDVAAEHLSKIPSLEEIKCEWKLSAKGLEYLANMDRLIRVNLYGEVTDEGIKSLSGMKSLKYLWFIRSDVTDEHIRVLKNNNTLESLRFSSPHVSSEVFETLVTIPNLKTLAFSNVRPEQDFDSRWHLLAELEQLTYLDVTGIRLSKKHLEPFEKLRNLRQLEIECPNVVDKALGQAMAGMKNLDEVHITAVTSITDKEIKKIAALPKLSILSIDETQITDDGLMAFANKPYLAELYIGSELLSNDAFERLGKTAPHDYLEHERIESEFGRSLNKDGLIQNGQGKNRKPFDEMQGNVFPEANFEIYANVPDTFRLNDLDGKIVLVQFWGTWCGPCVQAMPKLQQLHKEHRESGFEIVSIHSTTGSDQMQEFIDKHKIKWPCVSDMDKQTAKAWNVVKYPTYFLLNRDSTVAYAAIDSESLNEGISRLLYEE